MAEISFSLPFSIDSYGKVASTTDYSKLWADRVRVTLGTALGERVMRPEFGSFIPFTVFNSETDAVSSIETDVRTVFNDQLSLLTLNDTDITFDEYTGIISITVVYSLPNRDEVTTTVGIVTVTGTNPTAEEIK
jgi:phage baseplate assembly protein W